MSLVVFTLEDRVSGVIHPVLFSLYYMFHLRGSSQSSQPFLSWGYHQSSHIFLISTPWLVMDVVRLSILGNIVWGVSRLSIIKVIESKWLEIVVVMVEEIILEDVMSKVMVVTSPARMEARLKLRECIPACTMVRHDIEPIVMYS